MKARLQGEGLGEAQEIDRLRNIVIYDDHSQPILIVQKIGEGSLMTVSVTDPKFNEVLKNLGIGLNTAVRVVQR